MLKMNCEVYAKAEVYPTEDLDKVIKALSNIFNYDDIEIGDDYVCVSGKKESIVDFKEDLKDRKIRSVARKMMIKGIHANKISFNLSKQAALAGIPNFVEDYQSPLGEIKVEIKTDDVEKFIDWIAPFIE